MAEQTDIKAVIDQSDTLYRDNKWKEAFDLLSPYADKDSSDVELLWRLVRVFFRTSKFLSKNKGESQQLAMTGLDISKKALAIDSNNFQCRKWAGIILSHSSELTGQKEKIASAVQVREHFEKAIELDPNDMAVQHLLGRWHFNVASVPWYMRRAAKMIYSSPPNSTYHEALVYFETAESLNKENFFMNWLFLGKTHYALGNYPEAKKWVSKVVEHNGDSLEFIETKDEAAKLFKKL